MLGNVAFTLNREHSIPPSTPQTPYIPFPFLAPNFDPTHQVVLHISKILVRRVSPQQMKDHQKKREKEKEQGTKGKEVKPHLPIQRACKAP
jgi:hypothetical protein